MMVKIHLVGFEREYVGMNIERIRFAGFKNVSNINLTLDKMISLLSINSYGKSNVLTGIDFGFDFINQSDKVKKNMMCWRYGIPLNKCLKDKRFEFEVEFTSTFADKLYKIIYGYSFDWVVNEKDQPKVATEYLKIKDLSESQKYTNFITRDYAVARYKSSETGGCTNKIKIDDYELVINKIKAYDNLYYLDIVKSINDIKVYIDRHLDSKESYSMSPIMRKNFEELSLDEDKNVPRVLYNMKNEYPNKYELIINTFKDLFPFIEDIDIETIDLSKKMKTKIKSNDDFEISDKIYVLFAKDRYLSKNIEFNLMSDGARRVLLIFTYLALADINNYSLIAIEEPENSINPKLLQQYIMALDNFSEKVKIIMTSHSPYLINYLDPSLIYLGIPNKYGLASFSKIKKSLVNKIMNEASDLNMMVGDYLFDLMSGTDDDNEKMISYVE